MFNFKHQLEAVRSSVITLVLILACAILGLVWIGVGVNSLAVAYLGPLWGPVALGGVFLLPIVIFLIIHALPHNQKKRGMNAYEAAFANSSVGSISRIIDALSGTSPILATVAAVVAGFISTKFPQFLPTFSQIVVALAEEFEQHKVRRAESKVRKAAEATQAYERAPPPPDVEPVSKRRSKKTEDVY